MGSHSSAVTLCTVGVPQGSVLGPLLFSVYPSPLSTIAQSHQVLQQQYADGTQFYVALSPLNYSNEINTLQSCLLHIRSFRQIRLSMDHTMAISVASALVSSRLDYANSILFGCPQKHAARLQREKQALARL